MTKEIVVEIKPDGAITIEGKNFKGIECDRAMKVFEDALGVTKSRTNKPEYKQTGQHQKAGI